MSQKSLDAFTDAAAAAVARAIADIQRDAAHEREVRVAEHRARLAELDALTANVRGMEREIAGRLAALKDGEQGPQGEQGPRGPDVDMVSVRSMIDDAVASAVAAVPPAEPGPQGVPGPQGEPGAAGVSIELDVVRLMVDEAVAVAVAALPPAEAGKQGEPGPQGEPGARGDDVDMDAVRGIVVESVAAAVADLPPAPAGKDADPAVIAEMVEAAVSALPPAPAGKDADPAIIRQMVDDAVAALPPPEKGERGERGESGAPGLLPIVKDWEDKVHYAGMVVSHDGAMYQAERDTGRSPPHDDWRCIARAGRDGADGRSFSICGTYVDGGEHHALDVVILNGASFVAKRDDPGPCPGDGWQMIAAQGKRGQQGERGAPGAKGDRGAVGPAVTLLETDDEGLVRLTNADGSSVECDLYPVLSKLAR